MKLRFESNSLRLRLNYEDLQQLAAKGLLRESIAFSADRVFVYQLQMADVAEPMAELSETQVRVLLPEGRARQWLESSQVGIEADQPAGSHPPLRIIVEKDLPRR